MKGRSANQRTGRKPPRRKSGRRRQTQGRREVWLFRLIARIISRRQEDTD